MHLLIVWSPPEQWKKGPWLFRFYIGDEFLTQLCRDYFIKKIKIPLNTHQYFIESHEFFFSRGLSVSPRIGFDVWVFQMLKVLRNFLGWSLCFPTYLGKIDLEMWWSSSQGVHKWHESNLKISVKRTIFKSEYITYIYICTLYTVYTVYTVYISHINHIPKAGSVLSNLQIWTDFFDQKMIH